MTTIIAAKTRRLTEVDSTRKKTDIYDVTFLLSMAGRMLLDEKSYVDLSIKRYNMTDTPRRVKVSDEDRERDR